MHRLCSKSENVFALPDPPHVCRHWPLMLRFGEERGYQMKCRDPRCSLACYANWRHKEAAILARFLRHHLPDGMTTYRGSLTLPPGSTVTDHSRVVARFLRLIRTTERRTSRTVRVHLTAHVTAQDAMHYDLIAYTDMGPHPLRDLIRDAWNVAGGCRYSLKGITAGEVVAVAKYTFKDTESERAKYVDLPADNGLNLIRYASKFFDETTKGDLWKECIRDWFPNETDKKPNRVSNNDKGLCDPNDKIIKDVKTADDRVRAFALNLIFSHTPKQPNKALTPELLSRRVSIPLPLLRSLTGLTTGMEQINGCYWVRIVGDTTIVPYSAPVGPPHDSEGVVASPRRSEAERGVQRSEAEQTPRVTERDDSRPAPSATDPLNNSCCSGLNSSHQMRK